MRKIAPVTGDSNVKRVMLSVCESGCYVFLYDRLEDGPGFSDCLQESLAQAEQMCAERFGVKKADWKLIPDTEDGCQDDWVAPVRVVGRESGNPQWGKFERFEDGVWKLISTEHGISPDA